MRKLMSSTLILGLLCLPTVGLVGCGEEMKSETKTIDKSNGGTTTTTDEHKVESSGKNPPPNAEGEKAK